MKVMNPNPVLTPLDDTAVRDIALLVARQKKANGVLMKAVNFVGGQVEDGLKLLPNAVQGQIDRGARYALEKSFHLAAKTRTGRLGQLIGTDRMHKVLGTMSGAVGGVGGVGTAVAELPFATTVIFRAIQGVAEQYGEDPTSEETRMECLAVFGAGAPGDDDDGVDTAFIGARLSLTGPALQRLIAQVAPRFATMLSQKLASQSVPILGAVAGAGTNYAFVDYYVSVAHVHFGLRQMTRKYDEEQVLDVFHQLLADVPPPVKR